MRWDRDVFAPGDYALDSLLQAADAVDFAVMVASPDDEAKSRGVTTTTPRDNIVFEFGLFLGKLGRRRTWLLSTGPTDMKLPSDILGLTRLSYAQPADGNVRAALNTAVLQIQEQIEAQGRLDRQHAPDRSAPPPLPVPQTSNPTPVSRVSAPASGGEEATLAAEVDLLCENARAQGWTVKRGTGTLRLVSPKGQVHVLPMMSPMLTRHALRRFAGELRAGGLRVNGIIRRPPDQSPL